MDKHTPGGWVVQTHYGNQRFRDEDSDTTFSMVLPEGGSYPEDSICDVWGTEHDDEANAQLIAAAPDLLEALRGLLAVYQAMNNPRGPKEILAEAAIARATGAQNG